MPRLMGTSNEETGDCAKKRKRKRPRKAGGDGENDFTTCGTRNGSREKKAPGPLSPVSFAPTPASQKKNINSTVQPRHHAGVGFRPCLSR